MPKSSSLQDVNRICRAAAYAICGTHILHLASHVDFCFCPSLAVNRSRARVTLSPPPHPQKLKITNNKLILGGRPPPCWSAK